MRAGPNWAAHQTLTAEAATVLRHSLGLARRRRHAQVTPLHVAATLLTSKPSILLKSCLLSSRQPSLPNALHSRALELCFNVALNRLPTTPTIPLLNTQNASLSNALVAALKRAQAHQRRGCIEQQNQQTQQNNQQFMGVKVELEQLIISILDDPSVSRVMREAGFSSTAVKSQIEDYYSSTAAATTTAATTSSPFQGGLGLGLRCSSIHEPRVVHCQMVEIAKPLSKVEVQDELHFCADCAYNYKREADLLKSRSQQKPFPSWLQTHASDTLNKDDDLDLRKKWSRLCQSLHRDKHTQSLVISNNISCTPYSYPWWPIHNSISFTNSPMNPNRSVSSVKFSNDHGGGEKYCLVEEPTPSLNFLNNSEEKDVKITLSLGNCNAPDSGDFDEKSLEKLLRRRDLLRMLQENVPWQSEKIAPIVEALVDPRKSNKRDTWLMIHGNDTIGKRRLACAIAESLLGSAESLVYLNMKEARDRAVNLSDELLKGKLSDRKKLVVLVENVDLASSRFMRQLADQFETEGEQDNAGEVVFVLTKGVCDCNEEGVATKNSIIQMTLKVNESVDHHKRKLDWGLSSKAKKRRIDDKDDPVLGTIENGDTNIIDGKDYLSIDLNVKADDEEDENWEKTEDSSPNSSELTGDEQMTPHSFLGSIDNQFTFDQSLTRETEMSEFFASKLTESFHKVCGGDHNRFSFSIEESVLEKISTGSGFVLNNLLEKWLKNIFQTSLNTIRSSGRVGESVRLCLGEPEEGNLDEGFLSSSLPKNIQICFGN